MNPTLTLNNGVEMPSLGFGVFQIPSEQTELAVETAWPPVTASSIRPLRISMSTRSVWRSAALASNAQTASLKLRFGSAIMAMTRPSTLAKRARASSASTGLTCSSSPAAAEPVRSHHRRLPRARDAPRRRPCPGDRSKQLHARAPKAAAGRDHGLAGGEPDRAASLLQPAGASGAGCCTWDRDPGVVTARRHHLLPRRTGRQHL